MRSIPTIRRLTAAAVLGALAACASDGGTGHAIDDRKEWCAVIRDIDQRFTTVDHSDDGFEVKQALYKRIGELIGDLEDGVGVVDAPERDRVRALLDWGSRLTAALVAADDERDATRRVEPIYSAAEQEKIDGGAPWIRKHCGVDVSN
jgi:hypothetical protein